ncbi:Hypothetical predicted protein [Podarcis lilfordi]|uniref:Uncharacterized protein n=1 Tax=Podarcis lilfordi TaxID=74358 RepID=A0AA35NWY9_9SAUR|nr:Hypothetical predicted protein [Podarcis lilfordi]
MQSLKPYDDLQKEILDISTVRPHQLAISGRKSNRQVVTAPRLFLILQDWAKCPVNSLEATSDNMEAVDKQERSMEGRKEGREEPTN